MWWIFRGDSLSRSHFFTHSLTDSLTHSFTILQMFSSIVCIPSNPPPLHYTYIYPTLPYLSIIAHHCNHQPSPPPSSSYITITLIPHCHNNHHTPPPPSYHTTTTIIPYHYHCYPTSPPQSQLPLTSTPSITIKIPNN